MASPFINNMKLYATTTSERASKGQGGRWLEITIYGEDKKKIWIIKVRRYSEKTIIDLFNWDGKVKGFDSILNSEIDKGKKQKGEKWQDIDIATGDLIPRHE